MRKVTKKTPAVNQARHVDARWLMRLTIGVATPIATLIFNIIGSASAQTASSIPAFEADVRPLIEESCLVCHGEQTATPLNFMEIGFNLGDHEARRKWELIFDRIQHGEMPPPGMPRPDPTVAKTALDSIKSALISANLTARGEQRSPLRRLTRLEYTYTIQDLLHLDEALTSDISKALPAEADSGGFDTVAVRQSMSPLHVRAYLQAADTVLDAALQLGPRPPSQRYSIDYSKSSRLRGISEAVGIGMGLVKELDDGYAAFLDAGSTFTFHSQSEGFSVPSPGRYRVTIDAYPYQANTPVTLTVYRGSLSGVAAAFEELIESFELVGTESRTMEVTPFLRSGDLIAPSVADIDVSPAAELWLSKKKLDVDGYYGMKDYPGEGIALETMTIEGPLLDVWPPASTRQLLSGVEFDEAGEIRLTKAPYQHVIEVVEQFAPRAFRRPLVAGELEAYASLAEPLLAEGRSFIEAVRVPLRAILSSPDYLYYPAGSDGQLDDFGLAARLASFLWRSTPDAELFELAQQQRLSDPAVLRAQVERLLEDPKHARFIKDLTGQAYRLYELNATVPNKPLYPEYDDRLGQAMALETELFLNELITENLGVDNLIQSDFTFVNRQLAEHYGIAGVEGPTMRKVQLPPESVRGGLLTQASILKLTANGTTTSPIPRGNFVLANLLGTPPPPPPPGVAGLEPDTRGATTIREQLAAHKQMAVCANCHHKIDPPGFALESFDPIGGFRERYRVPAILSNRAAAAFSPGQYREGPPVDASGVTPAGANFSGIQEYKQLLLQDVDQVARHLVSQLLTFATGAEIEFADRDEVETILSHLRPQSYPLRTMIHEVVQSDLFTSQ